MRFFLSVLLFGLAFYAQALIQRGQFFWGFFLVALSGSLAFYLFTPWRELPSEEVETQAPELPRIRWDCNPWLLIPALFVWGGLFWLLYQTFFAGADSPGFSLGGYGISWILVCWLGFLFFLVFSFYPPLFRLWRRFVWKEWIPLGVLLLVCLGFGLYRLTTAPPTIHGDEGMVGLQARQILQGQIPSFFSLGWYSIPRFFFFLPACSMALFGDSLFGLRMSAVLLGTLSVVPFYLLARAWWGLWPAVLASVLLIANHWFLYLLHSGVHYGQAHFFAITLLCLWAFANSRRSVGLCVLAGVVLGLGLVSYQASQLLPVLWLGSQIWLWLFRQINWRWFATSVFVPLLIMGAVLAPWLLYAPNPAASPESSLQTAMFTGRAGGVLFWTEANQKHLAGVYKTSPSVPLLLGYQVERAFLAPVYYTDRSMQYFADVPILDRYAAVFFLLAVVMGCYQFFDRRWAIPLLWGGGILFGGVALTIDAPFYPRLAGSTAIYFLLIAGGMHAVLHSFRDRWVEKSVLLGFFGLCTLLSIGFNLNYFYNTYASDRNIRNSHYAQTELARYMKTLPPETYFYVFSGTHFALNSGTVQFIANGYQGTDQQQLPSVWKTPPFMVIVDGNRKELLPDLNIHFPDQKPQEHRSPLGDLLFYSIPIK